MLCSLRINLNTVIFNFLFCMYAYVFFAIYVCWYGALRAVTNTLLFVVFSVCISMSTVILLIVLFFLYLCTLTIYMHTVRFAFLFYYLLICCILLCFSISTVIQILLFSIYVSLLYMCAERCVLFITYLCAIFL